MKTIAYFVILSAIVSFSPAFAQESSADLILHNGKVFTADLEQPSAEAVAIRGERILAVGSSDEIKRLANAKTRLLDLQGRTVIPGINDAHFHFMPDPQGSRLQFHSQEPSWSETSEAIKNAVSQTPKGQWIFGEIGIRVLSEQEADRFALDRIAPEHPVLLRSYFGHGYVVNSRGMPRLQLVEEEPDPVLPDF
jgi:predicted amidohydrolase YtcJ